MALVSRDVLLTRPACTSADSDVGALTAEHGYLPHTFKKQEVAKAFVLICLNSSKMQESFGQICIFIFGNQTDSNQWTTGSVYATLIL